MIKETIFGCDICKTTVTEDDCVFFEYGGWGEEGQSLCRKCFKKYLEKEIELFRVPEYGNVCIRLPHKKDECKDFKIFPQKMKLKDVPIDTSLKIELILWGVVSADEELFGNVKP